MRGLLNCLFINTIICFFVLGCKNRIVEKEDEVYSRHLQEHVKLTIISTPMPDDKGKMNLLLFNDGQELGQIGLKSTLDSLYEQGLISPLLVVGIHVANRSMSHQIYQQLSSLVNIFIVPLVSIVPALLYLKMRQLGGENVAETLTGIEEADEHRSQWQQRMRTRLSLHTRSRGTDGSHPHPSGQ